MQQNQPGEGVWQHLAIYSMTGVESGWTNLAQICLPARMNESKW